MKLLAQNLGTIGQGTNLPFAGSGGSPIDFITHGISAIIGFLTICATIWFMFQLIIGGIQWVTSGGDKNGLESARNRLTHAFIGLIIVVAGWSIMALLGIFFGFDLLNPAKYLGGIIFK